MATISRTLLLLSLLLLAAAAAPSSGSMHRARCQMTRLGRGGVLRRGQFHRRRGTAFVHPMQSISPETLGSSERRFGSTVAISPPWTRSWHTYPPPPLRASLSTMDADATTNEQHEAWTHPTITGELNPSQKEAVLRPRYSITRVVAGPGAGKTKVLTCRMAQLLLDETQSTDNVGAAQSTYGRGGEGILAVTFTKKAAMEMERRLTDLLSSAIPKMDPSGSPSEATPGISTGEEEMEEGEYVQYGNADPDDMTDPTAEEASRRLARRTTVGTFHSVCSKILRKFGNEVGELPSVRQCVGAQNAAGATVVQGGIETESSNDDDRQQPAQPTLLQTLDGSFTIVDQADQLRLLKEVLKQRNIVLSSPAASSGGRNNDIRPITVLNAISLLNTIEAAKMTSPGGNGNEEEEEISSKMSRKVRKIATEVRLPFQRAKYTQNSLDFDDLILLTRELLLHHPEVREVLHRRWRHVLVDEFQDTSQVQLDLVRLLTTNSLFIVGDGDQSIYSWRGASPESMSDFEVAFHDRSHGWEGLLRHDDVKLSDYLDRICGRSSQEVSLEVKSVYLMENYRSTTNIVKAAQRIISMGSKGNADENTAAPAQDDIRRDMKPMRGTGPSPRVLACKDGRAEAKFVVNTVNSMIDSGDLTPSSTVALIYRTNAQSRLLEEACVEQNLRYVVKGSSGTFYKRAEIQDCMSFLKIMYNARDRAAWARAVKAPSRGIGEASLKEFFGYCDAVSEKCTKTATDSGAVPNPLDVMLSLAPANNAQPSEIGMLVSPKEYMSTRSLNRFVPFASSLRSLKKKAEAQSVSDFLLSVIEDLSLKSHFDSISKTKDEYEDRLGNVMELVRAAERYKEDGPCISPSSEDEPMDTPLGNFLDDVALIADLAPAESESEGGRVVANLMTIHSSKGMEFDAVFLVGNEEGTFPTQKSIAEGEGSVELSEERRLCYVAMTRAKTHLVLTWRREVSIFAGATFKTRDADRSRFLDALVSKRKEGSKPSTSAGRNKAPPRNNALKGGQAMGSMTKRELHSQANRLLASENSSWRGDNMRQKRVSEPVKKKRWDDWEPSSKKKPVRNIPSIKSTTSSAKRQILPSRTGNGAMQPALRRNSAEQVTRRDLRQSPSSERTIGQRPPYATPNRRHLDNRSESRGGDRAQVRGDAPPQIDSTVFFPVGSSVKHRLHGKGIVLTPPNADQEFTEKMLVRVKFLEENLEWDLPMDAVTHTYE